MNKKNESSEKPGLLQTDDNSYRPSDQIVGIYRAVMWIAIVLFVGSGFLYVMNKQYHFLIILFVFTCTAVYYLVVKDFDLRIPVIGSHIMILTLVTIGVAVFGWRYGTQYLLFIGISLGFFSPFKSNVLIILITAIEAISFIAFYQMFAFNDPAIMMSTFAMDVTHAFHVLFTFATVVFVGRKADLSSLIYSKKLVYANQQLMTLANHDPLTSLFNRRGMQMLLDNYWYRYTTESTPFFVVMCDVDGFKEINDSFGHDIGDLILQRVATILSAGLRQSDYVARWGGDEFLFLLTGATSEADVKYIMERIRLAVSKERFPCSNNMQLSVTMTFGCGSSKNKEFLQEVITEADAHLYEGKLLGKNVVVV